MMAFRNILLQRAVFLASKMHPCVENYLRLSNLHSAKSPQTVLNCIYLLYPIRTGTLSFDSVEAIKLLVIWKT